MPRSPSRSAGSCGGDSLRGAPTSVPLRTSSIGRIDVVINNAGYGYLASAEGVRLEDFKAQIDTNFYGVVHVTKAVIPFLRQQGSGHIFQVSSIGGRLASVGLTAYQAAKWAVGGFSLGVAQELAPFGVKVTVLEPGGMPYPHTHSPRGATSILTPGDIRMVFENI